MRKACSIVLIICFTFASGCGMRNSPLHPRLILTDSKLSELRIKACYDENGNQLPGCTPAPDWTKFHDLISPYEMDGSYYGMQAWHFALVYMVTKDIAYAQRAASLLDEEITNGMTDERFDSYLYAREYLRDAGLIYDWLHDFLTSNQKANYINYMNQLLTEIWNPFDNPYHTWSGWAIDDPGNNYYYNFLLATCYAGFATNNENPNPPSLPFKNTIYTTILDFLYAKIEEQAMPGWLNTHGKGGGWHEGQSYGLESKKRILELFWVLRDTGGVNYFTSLTFPRESLYYHLYSIQPGNLYEYPGGDLAREPTMSVSSYDRLLMLFLADGLEGTTEGRYAQFWLDDIHPSMEWQFMYPWDFLLYKPGLPSRDFRELPLQYYAEGMGWVTSRSSWADNATSVSFVSADRIQSHQHQDQNSFVIYKNGWQAMDSATSSHSGIPLFSYAHNTILVDGQGQRYGEGTGTITRYEGNNEYVYVVGNASDAYYSNAGGYGHGDVRLLQSFIRELVHIKPNLVIVLDRVTPVDPNAILTYLIHVPSRPYVMGRIVAAASGIGMIFQKSLLPYNFYMNVTNENNENPDLQSWRIELRPRVPHTNTLFLNVLYLTSTATTSMPEIDRIDASTHNMVGVHIKDSFLNWVVMFSSDASLSDITGNVAYTIHPTTMNIKNLLLNMNHDRNYSITTTSRSDTLAVSVTPTLGRGYQSIDEGPLMFTTSF